MRPTETLAVTKARARSGTRVRPYSGVYIAMAWVWLWQMDGQTKLACRRFGATKTDSWIPWTRGTRYSRNSEGWFEGELPLEADGGPGA
jgi:hypothetical protein